MSFSELHNAQRTQNTAQLYDRLGMAEYQAIEGFVKMF